MVTAGTSPVDADRAEAQRRAIQELLGPEYAHESLPDRLLRIGQQYLGDLLDVVGAGPGGILGAVLLTLIVAALAGLLIWQARKATGARAARDGTLLGASRRSAAEHRAEAERLAGEERWAEAIRERLRAIARDLEERAIVDALPGRTADELAAAAGRELPDLAADLAAGARLFDEVTYGGRPGDAAGYARLAALDDRVRDARPVPAA